MHFFMSLSFAASPVNVCSMYTPGLAWYFRRLGPGLRIERCTAFNKDVYLITCLKLFKLPFCTTANLSLSVIDGEIGNDIIYYYIYIIILVIIQY